MNKKFLSAVLFGALLASTTGTFTSCKDYDDDINGLNERVDAIEKTLADLNTKFGALAYVKSVSIADGKLVVTDQDGKSSSYTIPTNTDTNTTYTLDVTQVGNTATITLTDDKGGKQTKTISFTDTDTDTDKFDATKLVLGTDGVVSYNGIATGVKIEKPETFTLTIMEIKEDGVTIGWDINGTRLLITDALPITGFEYIPNKVLAGWGERVIVFEEHSYTEKVIDANAVEDTENSLFMSNVAAPQYQVNPSSATKAQLAADGKAVILKKTLEQVTRTPGTFIEWKKTEIEGGVMTVSLEADPALFEDETNKLDAIALQFETTAKDKRTITTEYVGVINKADVIDLRFTDASVNKENDGSDADHFALSKADAVAQKAFIDGDNMPLADNNPLVQAIPYTKAITGFDLKELISICNIKDEAGHKFFDYTKYPDLKLSFEAVPYNVKDTPQEKYMKLEGNKFTAINYDATDPVCIGKAPMVLAKLTDSHNKDAIVAAAYIKLLIVADAAAKPEADITITQDATIGIGCNVPAYYWATNDEFMSTQVYRFNANDKLIGLSKEQFHKLYTFSKTPVEGYVNEGDWTVKEILTTEDNKANHGAEFTLNDAPLKAGTYYAYAVYTKTTDASVIVSVQNGGMYPEHVVIKHAVKVDPVNFTATAKERVANAWDAAKKVASIYCQTPGTGNATRIVGDLNELFAGGKVQFDCEFDAKKYPSFVAANMDYKFVFSAENAKRALVTGVDGTQYQLALSAGNTKLYAVGKNLTGADIAAACVPANLVATLSGENNNDVEYANTTVAKNLLNKEPRGKDSFYAMMDIVYANSCDQAVDVIDGDFNLAFIRPVNVSANSDKFFTDGLNVGDESNVLKLGELVNFTDWRKDSPLNSFAAHLDYYKYYGVTGINCDDIKKVETNWTGERVTLEKAFGAELAAQIIKVTPNVATPDGTTLPDYGTVTYIKTSGAEIKSYELYIPLTITYTWGTIEETITVKVKATK